MKDLTSIRGKYYLKQLISEGEHEMQDFKHSVSDALKIARSISAFANNSGGRLLIGVKDNGTIAGVRNEEDIYVVEQAAQMYCRPPIELRFTMFTVDDGLKVIRAEIPAYEKRGVKARENDGSWRAYYRVADENIAATAVMVESWKRATSDAPVIITSGSAEERVLRALDSGTTGSIQSLSKALHLSTGRISNAITVLYAGGLINFQYTGKVFVITRKHDE